METLEKTTVEVSLPFSGFYESIHSYALEFCLGVSEDHFYMAGKEGEPTKEEVEKRYDEIAWKEAHTSYAKAYADKLCGALGFPMEFAAMESPREYNFTTDRIFVRVPFASLVSLFGKTDYAALTKAVKETFTSGPGFSSFYSPELAEWEADGLQKWNHNQWSTVIETYLLQSLGDDWESDVMDTVRGNGGGQ